MLVARGNVYNVDGWILEELVVISVGVRRGDPSGEFFSTRATARGDAVENCARDN
jgi:hypothetical protein